MRRLLTVITCTFIMVNVHACSQEPKPAPLDFTQAMWNISANTRGRIQAETWYKNEGNDAGNARVYMIHKNGGTSWISQARKKYPTKGYPQDWMLQYIDKNRKELSKYNKWAF